MKHLFIFAGLLTTLIFSGCENNDLFLSEKKLKKEIQHTWKIVSPSPSQDSHEYWTFSDGKLSITYSSNPTDITVSGRYSIDAKIQKAYVELSDFSFIGQSNSLFTASALNRKWTLVELKDGVLYLSGTDDSGAIRSIEFEQK